MNAGPGLPAQTQQPQFPQVMQPLPARPPPGPPPTHGPTAPNHGPPPPSHSLPPPSHVPTLPNHVTPPQQVMSMQSAQQSGHILPGSSHPPHVQASNPYLPGHGAPFSASYTVRTL